MYAVGNYIYRLSGQGYEGTFTEADLDAGGSGKRPNLFYGR